MSGIQLTLIGREAQQFAFTISSDTTNGNLRTLAVNAGWNQTSKVVATIGAGIYMSANSTGTPGLTISGSFPGGLELINNGFIVGMGGNGGFGGRTAGYMFGGAGSAGGLALSVSTAVSITNNGTVGGGGGGGGGGGPGQDFPLESCTPGTGGGGGGGGRTGRTNSGGGSGGPGVNGGGSGGTGDSGTVSGGGNGGGSGGGSYIGAGGGGNGGNWGASGASGGGSNPGAGGGAGAATSGNSNITWVVTGTRLGALN